MSFRLRLAAWSAVSVLFIAATLMFTAHWHLDEELRKDRWDRTHPRFQGWVIHGSYTDEEVHDILGELIRVWLWTGVPLIVASGAVGYFMARRSLRPIRRLNQELTALDSQSLTQGVHSPEQDKDLALLVEHINDLLGRVGHAYQEMAEFSARVAHELRTPLTLLRMRVEAAAPNLPPDFSDEVQEEIGRLSRLVEQSLLAAKAEGGKLEVERGQVDLSGLLGDLQEGYALLAKESGMTLEWNIVPGLMAQSDPALLRQVLHNLLGNAIRHGTERARIVGARSMDRRRVCLRISNFVGSVETAQIGAGIGLRLVRSVSNALGESRFKTRRTGRVFSVRLVLPLAGKSHGRET